MEPKASIIASVVQGFCQNCIEKGARNSGSSHASTQAPDDNINIRSNESSESEMDTIGSDADENEGSFSSVNDVIAEWFLDDTVCRASYGADIMKHNLIADICMSPSDKAHKACKGIKDQLSRIAILHNDVKSRIQTEMVDCVGINVLWDTNGVGLLVHANQKIGFLIVGFIGLDEQESSKVALLSAYDKLKSGDIKLDADGNIIFDENSADENEQYKGIVLLKPSHGRYSFDFMNPTKPKVAKHGAKKPSSNTPSQTAPTTQATTPPVHVVSGAIDPNTGICQHCGTKH